MLGLKTMEQMQIHPFAIVFSEPLNTSQLANMCSSIVLSQLAASRKTC